MYKCTVSLAYMQPPTSQVLSSMLLWNISVLSGAEKRTYVDSFLHQEHLQNIRQHTSHRTGLLYLAYISGKLQTSCHSCQIRRSQGCHYMGMAGMIPLVLKVVQNSLLHT